MTASIGRKLLFAAPLAVALFGLGPRPAWAASKPVSVCGQELSEPGDYHLTQDIGPCTGHGVIITGPVDSARDAVVGFQWQGFSGRLHDSLLAASPSGEACSCGLNPPVSSRERAM